MVGTKKSKSYESQSSKKLSDDEDSSNSSNSEFILDLDELHINVTPPSELFDNYSFINEIGKIKNKKTKILFLIFI